MDGKKYAFRLVEVANCPLRASPLEILSAFDVMDDLRKNRAVRLYLREL